MVLGNWTERTGGLEARDLTRRGDGEFLGSLEWSGARVSGAPVSGAPVEWRASGVAREWNGVSGTGSAFQMFRV